MNGFQSALAMAFDAGPAEVPELTIDQLDGRLGAGLCGCREGQPALTCYCAAEQPVATCWCRGEQPVIASICSVERPVPVAG